MGDPEALAHFFQNLETPRVGASTAVGWNSELGDFPGEVTGAAFVEIEIFQENPD